MSGRQPRSKSLWKESRKYLGLVIPIGFVAGRVCLLGRTSLETLQKQPVGAAAAHFKAGIMWEMWAAVLALGFMVIVVEREPLASIGFRKPSWQDFAWVPVVMIGSLVLGFVWAVGFAELSGYSLSSIPHVRKASITFPFGVRFLMFVTEPAFEETVFRGYLIERLISLTGSIAAAAGISAVGSSLMHGGWTLGLFILPFESGLALLYGWRRNLPACLTLHALWMLTPGMSVVS